MIAHNIDHGRIGAPRIMDIGCAIGIARPQMQKRHGGLSGNPGKAIGGTRRHAFKQA